MARTWSSKSWIHETKECRRMGKVAFYRGCETLAARERKKKKKKGRRRRIPYPAERNGRRSSPYLFDRATTSRERRFWTNLFHRVANLFHPTANTRPLFPPNKQKFCSTKELTFHELCNHEISINERFVRRYRRMKQKWEELIVQKIRKWRDWKKLLFNSTLLKSFFNFLSLQDRLLWRVIIFELFARVYFRLDSVYKFITLYFRYASPLRIFYKTISI